MESGLAMLGTFSLPVFPDELRSYLESVRDSKDLVFRRRAVFIRWHDDDWVLICSTVECLATSPQEFDPSPSRYYDQAILYEDWLTLPDCLQFIDEMQEGVASFGDIVIARDSNAQWVHEYVPQENRFMHCAGQVVQKRIEDRSGWHPKGPLLKQNEPYYPDFVDAARDWLPLSTYHGESDGRNQSITFLFPERRAFFTEALWTDGILELSIAGTAVNDLSLAAKGAYREGKETKQFDVPVSDGRTSVAVPNDVEWIDCILWDSDGTVYDFHREDRFGRYGIGLNGNRDLEEQVKAACLSGEGERIEFKPFVDCNQGMGPKKEPTKFREIVKTVVAFANTKGGRLFIGVDDECRVTGIARDVAKWAKADVDQAVERYRGALTNRVRDNVDGEFELYTSYATVGAAIVVVIDVAQSMTKPVSVSGDNIFYVRAGASNKQLPPGQWKAALHAQTLAEPF